jgi:hypothetical protein
MKEPENSFDKFVRENINILGNIQPMSEQMKADIADREKFKAEIIKGLPFGFYSKPYATYWAKKTGQNVNQAIKKMQSAKIRANNYRKLILGTDTPKIAKPLPKVQLMDYNEAKREFWEDYLSTAFEHKGQKYQIDDDNRGVVSELVKYFIYDPSCKLNLFKGVCLIGGVGTGKSELLKQLSRFLNEKKLSTAFAFVDMLSVTKEFQVFGLKAYDKYMDGDVCFDEIAIRKTFIKSFGTDIQPTDEIIQGRYKRFTKRISRPTHFTSNIDLNPEDEAEKKALESTYDVRSIDRLKEMCNFVYLGGDSRRN